jgi:glutamate-5-semialdehyde dehydrogenase
MNVHGQTAEAVVGVIRAAKEAARFVAGASTSAKNQALKAMAESLKRHQAAILAANALDIAGAQQRGENAAFIDRLTLNEQRLQDMVTSILSVVELPDPVGAVLAKTQRPNGLEIVKVRIPLGVIGIVYESRPNVTADCAALCLKSGNAVVLRGGTEAFSSNQAIHAALVEALRSAHLPEAAVSLIPVREREAVDVMLKQDKWIDVIIPRGGEGLIRKVVEGSTIPVMKHAKGICHVYVDAAADLNMAGEIALNAKVQRPGVCNAMETLLVHEAVAEAFLPDFIKRLRQAKVEVRGDQCVQQLASGIVPATEEDWDTEYLDLILSIRVVPSLEAALEHIRQHGSGHSDAIVTRDHAARDRFLHEVDSAAVYANASTRFTDGYQFGLGAEMGISTDRLHARGPVALEELTTYKYVVYGNGQVRQ